MENDGIHVVIIRNWPTVFGMFELDTVQIYQDVIGTSLLYLREYFVLQSSV